MAIRAVPGQSLVFFRFAQDVAHIDEGYRALRRIQRPRASFSLAGFQVTFIGRFWVTAEDLCGTQRRLRFQTVDFFKGTISQLL